MSHSSTFSTTRRIPYPHNPINRSMPKGSRRVGRLIPYLHNPINRSMPKGSLRVETTHSGRYGDNVYYLVKYRSGPCTGKNKRKDRSFINKTIIER